MKKVANRLGGYQNLSNFRFYDYWMNKKTLKTRANINVTLDNFIKSKEIFMLEKSYLRN